MAEQPNDNYARHDHNHDGVYTPIPTFEEHAADPVMHGAYTSVPDYSQTQNVPGFPYTCTKSGIVYLSWSIDTRICVVPTINGRRIMAFGEGNTEGGYTSTIAVSKDDVLDMLYINSSGVHDSTFQPNMGDIQDSSDLTSFTSGSKYQTIYARFVPYKHQADATAGGVFNNVYNNMPVGSVCWFKLNAAPDGWVVCNGKWYSEDGKYSADNYTEVCTIQSPNLIGRYALGSEVGIGELVEAGLPNITGAVAKFVDDGEGHMVEGITDGAFYAQKYTDELTWWTGDATSDNKATVNFDASRSNAVYGNSDTVTPPSTKLLPCMKIFNAEETLLMSVPDYSQTIDIMQFPWTATVSGQIVLSWSIDNRYIVMPCVNGVRICGFADSSTEGGFTTTFSVAKDDVVTIEIITNTNGGTANGPEMLSIDGMGTIQGNNNLFILGSYRYVMYARFTPFKNQTISNLAGDVELYFGSHTGVHEAEATGNVTTTDPSKTVTVVKDTGTITLQQTIDGVLVDLTDPSTTPPSQSGYVDIGDLRIIYGMTPVIPRANSYNQIVRIKLPQSVSTLLSVTTTIVMTGNNYDGSQLRAHDGPECSAQVMRVIDDYMYVFLDGHVSGAHPEVAISYNIFTTK